MIALRCCSHAGDMCCWSVGAVAVVVTVVVAGCCAGVVRVLRLFHLFVMPGGGVGGCGGDSHAHKYAPQHGQNEFLLSISHCVQNMLSTRSCL